MNNTRKIPSLITLLGCLAAAIACYVNHYTLKKMLITILWVLIVFYILGFIAKVLFDKYIPPLEPEPDISDEGSVIEKTSEDGEHDGFDAESEEDGLVSGEAVSNGNENPGEDIG